MENKLTLNEIVEKVNDRLRCNYLNGKTSECFTNAQIMKGYNIVDMFYKLYDLPLQPSLVPSKFFAPFKLFELVAEFELVTACDRVLTSSTIVKLKLYNNGDVNYGDYTVPQVMEVIADHVHANNTAHDVKLQQATEAPIAQLKALGVTNEQEFDALSEVVMKLKSLSKADYTKVMDKLRAGI